MSDNTKSFTDQEALRFHTGQTGQARNKPDQAHGDPARFVAGLFAGRCRAGAGHCRQCGDVIRLHLARQYGRRHFQRNGHFGAGKSWSSCRQTCDGGKAVLFKRFADVDSIDLEVDTEDPTAFIDAVKHLGPSFGGINLEDIRAPDCFIIEQQLRELMDIPVFHDDQHGTAIICAAGLINALHLTGRDIKDIKVAVNGAGSAGIACLELIKAMGLPAENAILCDTKGVIYKGRKEASTSGNQPMRLTLTPAHCRCAEGRRCVFGSVGKRCHDRRDGARHGRQPDYFCHGKS